MTSLQSSLSQLTKRVSAFREDKQEIWADLIQKKLIKDIEQYSNDLDKTVDQMALKAPKEITRDL